MILPPGFCPATLCGINFFGLSRRLPMPSNVHNLVINGVPYQISDLNQECKDILAMIASTRESIMRLEADLNAFRYAERKLSDDLSLKVAANCAPANGAATSHASVYSYTCQASREIPSTNVEKPEVICLLTSRLLIFQKKFSPHLRQPSNIGIC